MRRLFNPTLGTTATSAAEEQHSNGDIQTNEKKGWFGSNLINNNTNSNSETRSITSSLQRTLSNNDQSISQSREKELPLNTEPRFHDSTTSPLQSREIEKSASNSGPGGKKREEFFEKDELMLELLVGQASVEAKNYGILSWEEMTAIKAEHTLLQPRVKALTRSVALETRLRDSASKLVKLSLPSSPNNNNAPTSSKSSRQTVTKEQAVNQLVIAEEKLEKVEKELWKIGFREGELGRKLLIHTAGVLALTLRKKEELESDSTLSPSEIMENGSMNNMPLYSASSSNGLKRKESKFDGFHYFSGHSDSIIPSLTGSLSRVTSPGLSSSRGFTNAIDTAQLEEQIIELKNELKLERDGKGKARDLLQVQQEEESRSSILELKQELMQEKKQVKELTKSMNDQLLERSNSRDASTLSSTKLNDLQSELKEKMKELELFKNGSNVHEKEITNTKVEAAKQISSAKMEMEEAHHSTQIAQQKLSELRLDLEQERDRASGDTDRLRETIRDLEDRILMGEKERGGDSKKVELELSKMTEEKRKLTQSIGDVLRRHRTRSILGPAIRDLTPFDDSSDRSDLSAYVASTLESHFVKISDQVSTMEEELNKFKGKEVEVKRGHQFELSRIINERERENLESQKNRESLEESYKNLELQHLDLKKLHDSNLSKSNNSTELEKELNSLKSESVQIGYEYSTLQSKSANLEEDLLFLKKSHSKLQSTLEQTSKEAEIHKVASQRAAKVLDDRNEDLGTYQATIKDLEERAEVSATQEVAMLERLNEFTERLEQTRSEKRKLDSTISSNQSQLSSLAEEKIKLESSLKSTELELSSLQKEFSALSSKPSETLKLQQLTETLQERTDSLSDLQEELEEARDRESSSRGKLLKELAELQGEVSKLKTELRQAKRMIVPSPVGK